MVGTIDTFLPKRAMPVLVPSVEYAVKESVMVAPWAFLTSKKNRNVKTRAVKEHKSAERLKKFMPNSLWAKWTCFELVLVWQKDQSANQGFELEFRVSARGRIYAFSFGLKLVIARILTASKWLRSLLQEHSIKVAVETYKINQSTITLFKTTRAYPSYFSLSGLPFTSHSRFQTCFWRFLPYLNKSSWCTSFATTKS